MGVYFSSFSIIFPQILIRSCSAQKTVATQRLGFIGTLRTFHFSLISDESPIKQHACLHHLGNKSPEAEIEGIPEAYIQYDRVAQECWFMARPSVYLEEPLCLFGLDVSAATTGILD